MFEQDYIMRLIRELVRAVCKLIFHIDTETPGLELFDAEREQEQREALEGIIRLADQGRINEAENLLFEWPGDGNQETLKMALVFYAHLNGKTDAFLAEHDFSREEIRDGLHEVMSRYGLESLSETFED